MLFTRNYKKYHSITLLLFLFNKSKLIGYNDAYAKKNYLKSPFFLHKYNMCSFINFEEFFDGNFKLLSYKGYLITNQLIKNKFFIQQVSCNKINLLIIVIIIYNIVLLYSIVYFMILKLIFLTINFNIN